MTHCVYRYLWGNPSWFCSALLFHRVLILQSHFLSEHLCDKRKLEGAGELQLRHRYYTCISYQFKEYLAFGEHLAREVNFLLVGPVRCPSCFERDSKNRKFYHTYGLTFPSASKNDDILES